MTVTSKIAKDASYQIVPPERLRWTCDSSRFMFKTTEEIDELKKIVGQPRAIEAIKIGAELNAKGYNIFVTGLSGTGRLSTVKHILEEVTTICPQIYDYCYVYNFKDPDRPVLIKLPNGLGRQFAAGMDDAVSFLRRRLPKLFEEETYQQNRRKIIDDFQSKEKDVLNEFDERIKPYGFIRGQLENEQGAIQPEVFPLVEGKPVQIEVIDSLLSEGKLTVQEANDYKKHYTDFHSEIFDLARQGMKMMQEYKKALSDNDKASSDIIVTSALQEIKELCNNPKTDLYIEEAIKYILDNIHLFVHSTSQAQPQLASIEEGDGENDTFTYFKVNVVLDNSEITSAPIVVETTPSFLNLFGTIEKTFDKRGFWRTDFTKIKAGALLKADQGFLIVNANDLLTEPGVWNALKRVLLYDKLEIQPYDSYFQISQSLLKPEPIEVNVKVIIIGGQSLYHTLYQYEKGFKKIFKINAQFDYEIGRDDEMIDNYAKFIAKICNEDHLPHCTPDGVGAIIEWAVEFAGTQNKITLKFSDVADIVREAAFYLRQTGLKYINKEVVDKTINARRTRNNLMDDKVKAQIFEGNLLIDTKNERVGQINGLTIYNTGLLSFGKPARITASISAGNAGIINVEREADMSGSIHNKGVMIISGFLREKFASKKPMSLTASIAFEQSYGGVDGDSASCAEIYVILSSISGIPIKQSFAITGSVNQKGDVQPIGGVNDKVRGFFEICKYNGLTGENGVIIPEQNVKDLMLPDEIIKAVKEGLFKVYSIKRIEDGAPLLMGIQAGELDEKGNYPKDTLFGKVVDKLEEFSKAATDTKNTNVKPKKKNNKTKKDERKVVDD